MTKRLVSDYFKGQCTSSEETAVEAWMNANLITISLAEQWLAEPDEESEKLFSKLKIAKKEVWNKTSQDIISNGPN